MQYLVWALILTWMSHNTALYPQEADSIKNYHDLVGTAQSFTLKEYPARLFHDKIVYLSNQPNTVIEYQRHPDRHSIYSTQTDMHPKTFPAQEYTYTVREEQEDHCQATYNSHHQLLCKAWYNAHGHLTQLCYYSPQGTPEATYQYEYKHHILARYSQECIGAQPIVETYQHISWDGKGNWTIRAIYQNNQLHRIQERILVYE